MHCLPDFCSHRNGAKQHWPEVSLVHGIVTSATPGDFFIAVLYWEKVRMWHTADLAQGVLLQDLCCPHFPFSLAVSSALTRVIQQRNFIFLQSCNGIIYIKCRGNTIGLQSLLPESCPLAVLHFPVEINADHLYRLFAGLSNHSSALRNWSPG